MSVNQTKLLSMTANPTWANIGVICFEEKSGCSIETISVDQQSCTLSGAWQFNSLDDPNLANIIQGRLVITSGMQDGQKLSKRFGSRLVDLNTFIADASKSAKDGVNRFNKYLEENAKHHSEYMAIPPANRKLLPKVVKKKLEPIYAHSWEVSFDELKPELTLRQLGKREAIEGTPPSMKRLVSTSWVIKHLVDRWRDDEIERKSRDYLYPEGESVEVLPSSWMTELLKINASN